MDWWPSPNMNIKSMAHCYPNHRCRTSVLTLQFQHGHLREVVSVAVEAMAHGPISRTILSGWWCNNHLEKYEFVSWDNYPIYEMENKTCSKPPLYGMITSFVTIYNWWRAQNCMAQHSWSSHWIIHRNMVCRESFLEKCPPYDIGENNINIIFIWADDFLLVGW